MIKKYMKGNWIYAILAPICILIDTIGMMIVPKITSNVIDIGVANGDVDYIIKQGIIAVVGSLICMIGGFFAMYFSAKASYGFGANLRKDLVGKIQEFSFANINKFTTSSLVTRLTNDVEVLVNLVQMCLRMLIRTPIVLVGGILMLYLTNIDIAKLFFLLIPVLFVLIGIVLIKAFPMFKKVQEKIDKLNSVIRENLVGARVVKSFVREEYENGRFEEANQGLKDITVKSFGIMIFMMPMVSLVMNVAIALVLWIGSSGTVEAGALSAAITYMMLALTSLMMLSMVFMNFSRAKASKDRINEILNEVPDIQNKENPVMNKIEKGEVEYDVESFSFADSHGDAILENIKFKINPGEMVAIIGSTGTGKSTLVNLMPRFYDVTKGKVLIDGIDVRDYDLTVLRDSIGMVLQENRLFEGTIEENIKWGKNDATVDEVKEACRIAQIDTFIENLPDKYNSHVEQRGANFSGGQKQRLCIARALIKKPKILILDDSVSALDSTTENNLRKALKEQFKGTTIFMIVQKISSCREVDRVLVVDDGTIVGNGTHEELLENNEVYKEISESQKEVMPEE